MNLAASSPIIETYFAELNSRILDLPRPQREELVKELRAHVMDRLEQMTAPGEEDCRTVLKALGTPDEIARQFRMELILRRSSWRISPVTILRTSARWTVAGVQGYAIFLVAVIGYLMALSFYLTALLKPLFPRNVGVFVGDQGLTLAHFPFPPAGHEVLGPYYIPAAIVIGYLFTLGTTLLIRFLARRGRSLRQRLA
jgi:uncharacterized membrane protein